MKLLHTSDWHLGAKLGRHDRTPDHLEALRGLLEVAEGEAPDLILHTGDLFDSSRPPHQTLKLGVTALGRLARIAPTVVIAGNHDSPRLLEVIDDLAAAADPRRLWLVTTPEVLSFPGRPELPVSVACVPFIPPGAIADFASGDPSRFEGDYADGIQALNRGLLEEAHQDAGPGGIVLYAAHLHLQGARPGKSERRITVGEDYAAHVEGLHRASYCAFGHIHDPQLLPGGTAQGRYAGSLIALDFGERERTKQAVLVTIADDVRVETRDLPAGRPLTEFAGTLADLQGRAEGGGLDGCILKARVISDDPILDLADRLAGWSPDCAVFELINTIARQPVKPIDPDSEGDEEPQLDELFREWRGTAARGIKAPDDDVCALFAQALGGVGQEAGPDFGLTPLLSETQEVLDRLAASPNPGGP
ncbi:MAG: exonuclease SbcCD subunit D [Gemmatimonadaceae bacterium]|nr:exonuclease SbcCD subunit D [Gemmatimonadaceae bacterium]